VLEDKMLIPMQLQFNLTLQSDDELFQKAGCINAGRVVVKRFLLRVPKLIPKDSLYDNFVSSFLKETKWSYLRSMYQMSVPSQASGFYQISTSVDNAKCIFVYLQRNKTNVVAENPYLFDAYKLNDVDGNSYLTTCRLEYRNGIFYPETEYDTESKVRIFNDLMSCAQRRNDYNTGTQLNLANFNSFYGMIYFDLTNQTEKVTRDPKQLIFRYKINVAPVAAFNVHTIVFYEEMVVINKVGNELVIV